MDLNSVFRGSSLGIVVYADDGRFVLTNRAYQELHGYSDEELRRTTVYEITHEADRGRMATELRRLYAGEVAEVKIEKRHFRRDGAMIWVHVRLSVVRDDATGAVHVMGIVEDITARKDDEERLRRSEAYLAEGQRISHTASWALNTETGELFCSREMYRITGFDEQAGPPRFSDLVARIHVDDRARVEHKIQHAIASRTTFEGEYRIEMPDGRLKVLHYRGHPIEAEPGDPYEYVGTVMDVTEARVAEQRLSASLREVHSLAGRLLRVQDEERRRIARELHETTAQDLAALKMNLGLLERLAPQAAERRREVLDESAALVQRALTDVRTISYLLHPPLLDEAGLASAMRWYVEGFARRSGIHVELELPDDILRLAEDRETALFRIVQESLINIHRHADSPVARVRLRHGADRVVLEIEDEGRGIPVADSAMAQSSLGVGIAGMRERMEQLGGRLELASTDRGTTVRAILPREMTS